MCERSAEAETAVDVVMCPPRRMLINVPMWECTDVPIRETSATEDTVAVDPRVDYGWQLI